MLPVELTYTDSIDSRATSDKINCRFQSFRNIVHVPQVAKFPYDYILQKRHERDKRFALSLNLAFSSSDATWYATAASFLQARLLA